MRHYLLSAPLSAAEFVCGARALGDRDSLHLVLDV